MNLRKFINRRLKGTKYYINKVNPALSKEWECKITINNFLAKILIDNADFFFVQIGANDGIRADDTYDLITQHQLKGVVLEPLVDMFEHLCQNYSKHDQIQKINKAIHASEKRMTLYRIKADAKVPDWCHGIASFDKNNLLNHKAKSVPNIEQYIIEEQIECISLDELFEEEKISSVSFLQLDTEGYDFEIIKMIDFNKIKPQIIRYESNLLPKIDNKLCIELLHQNGYTFFDEGNDIIAIQ